ncbi:MAG: hypothetical protein RLZZ122_434 [Actinomycetota bacterium]
MKTKIWQLTTVSLSVLILLTGCNPPMPDSLRVELAERTVQCGEEFVDTKVLPEFVDIIDFWNSSMDVACAGAMGLSILDSYPTGAGLVVSEEEVKGCTPYASVPLAVDAAVFSFMFTDVYEINLSPELIAAIFRGEVTEWTDERITKLNPDAFLPSMPINIIPEAPPGAISAMEVWLSSETGESVKLEGLVPAEGSEVDALYEMVDGDLKLTSFGSLQISGMNYANMLLDEADPSSIVLPDVLTIQTGIGQTVVSGEAPNLTFVYDPSIPAEPLPGQFEALRPWGALYPVNLALCGEDNLQTRFAARFLLRLDAQGSISTGVFSPLKEEIRIASIALVDDGLPEVEIPEELERELQQ